MPDGVVDPVIGAAAADVIDACPHLIWLQPRFLAEDGGDGHDHARLAVATLGYLGLNPGPLYPAQGSVTQAFNGKNAGTVGRFHRDSASADGTAVEMNCASSAKRITAAKLGALHPQQIPQHPEQWHAGARLDRVLLAIDRHFDRHFSAFCSPPESAPLSQLAHECNAHHNGCIASCPDVLCP